MNSSPLWDQLLVVGIAAAIVAILGREFLITLYWRRVAELLARADKEGGDGDA